MMYSKINPARALAAGGCKKYYIIFAGAPQMRNRGNFGHKGQKEKELFGQTTKLPGVIAVSYTHLILRLDYRPRQKQCGKQNGNGPHQQVASLPHTSASFFLICPLACQWFSCRWPSAIGALVAESFLQMRGHHLPRRFALHCAQL